MSNFKSKFLEEKTLSARVHFPSFVDPLVLARFGVERTPHQPAQLEREPRTEWLQPGLFRTVEYVPMVPKKYKIALVVERRDPAALEVGPGTEKGAKHATNPLPKPRRKSVENHLWFDVYWLAAVGNILGQFYVTEFVIGRGSVRKMNVRQCIELLAVFIDNDNVSKTLGTALIHDLFYLKVLPLVVDGAGDHAQQLQDKIVHDFGRFVRRCDDHARGRLARVHIGKLIDRLLTLNLFIARVDNSLVLFLRAVLSASLLLHAGFSELLCCDAVAFPLPQFQLRLELLLLRIHFLSLRLVRNPRHRVGE